MSKPRSHSKQLIRSAPHLKPLTALLFLLFQLFLIACGGSDPNQTLRLATTTSTYDSGLLDAIVPTFEAETGSRVEIVAVGTGQALALGEAGDADVILVHARSREETFVADNHGTARFDVMYNDFIIVGPPTDPANINGLRLASEAMSAIAAAEAPFASRGDDSGTHSKELSLWQTEPSGDWYNALGQGMGATLNFANESGAYTLTDRGTFLAQQANLPNLIIHVGGESIADNEDGELLNQYGLIPINPQKGNINDDLASAFVQWLTSFDTQANIELYGVEQFGQPLFYPDSEAWRGQ